MPRTLPDTEIWLGRAFCTVARSNAEPAKSALLNFACNAPDVVSAAQLVQRECQENAMQVQGFEYLMCRPYMDREPSEYEMELISKLIEYPVQFRDVFVFGADG